MGKGSWVGELYPSRGHFEHIGPLPNYHDVWFVLAITLWAQWHVLPCLHVGLVWHVGYFDPSINHINAPMPNFMENELPCCWFHNQPVARGYKIMGRRIDQNYHGIWSVLAITLWAQLHVPPLLGCWISPTCGVFVIHQSKYQRSDA